MTQPHGEPEWWERVIDGADTPVEGEPDNGADDDELYVPPEPPPIPYISPPTVLGALGIFAGLALILWPGWLAQTTGLSEGWVLFIGLAMLLAGVITLISRLPNPDPDEENDPDNGAAV